MFAKQPLAFVAPLFLLVFSASVAMGARTVYDNTRLAYYATIRENQRWQAKAVEEEAALVKKGDAYLKDKQYDKARNCYREALDITYQQWVIEGMLVTTRKQQLHLNTAITAQARQKLQNLDAVETADSKQEWKKQALAVIKQGDAAAAQKDFARAYSLYAKIVLAAAKDNRISDAATADQARKKQQDILKNANTLLDATEKLLAGGKATDATAKFAEFLASYGALQELVPDIKARVEKLAADPAILQELRDQKARDEAAAGDESLKKEDYVSALRHYRLAATMAPDSEASRAAAEKLAQLQNDPQVAEGVKKQEAEGRSRLLYMQAETLRTQGMTREAVELYRRLLADFPDSSFVKAAREMISQLEPDVAPPAPQE